MSHLKWFHGFMELLVFYVQNISDLQQADKNKILISPFAVLRRQTFSLDYIFILSNAQIIFRFPVPKDSFLQEVYKAFRTMFAVCTSIDNSLTWPKTHSEVRLENSN